MPARRALARTYGPLCVEAALLIVLVAFLVPVAVALDLGAFVSTEVLVTNSVELAAAEAVPLAGATTPPTAAVAVTVVPETCAAACLYCCSVCEPLGLEGEGSVKILRGGKGGDTNGGLITQAIPPWHCPDSAPKSHIAVVLVTLIWKALLLGLELASINTPLKISVPTQGVLKSLLEMAN